jgi:hypothetical protein
MVACVKPAGELVIVVRGGEREIDWHPAPNGESAAHVAALMIPKIGVLRAGDTLTVEQT